MSEDIFTEDEEETMLCMEPCFGEYGKHQFCPRCNLRERCQKFTNAERQISIRHKGKYTGRGKERKRERY